MLGIVGLDTAQSTILEAADKTPQLLIRQQNGRAVAGEMLEAWVHGSLNDLDGRPARLRRVTTEDVLRVAGSVFDAERRAEYVVRGTAR